MTKSSVRLLAEVWYFTLVSLSMLAALIKNFRIACWQYPRPPEQASEAQHGSCLGVQLFFFFFLLVQGELSTAGLDFARRVECDRVRDVARSPLCAAYMRTYIYLVSIGPTPRVTYRTNGLMTCQIMDTPGIELMTEELKMN